MLALAFDTSTPMVSVAVVDESSLPIVEQQKAAPNAQGETLAPLIAETCRAAGVALADLDAIGVGLGPGPFTGLRVGVVTAASLADALGIPAHGMCSLDSIAQSPARSEPFAVVTDARRKQVYWATYDDTGGRTAGPELAPPADLAAALSGQVRMVVGAGALLYANEFVEFDVRDSGSWPSARVIGEHALAQVSLGHEPTTLEPLYLRRPDARPPGAPKRVTSL